MNQNINDIVQIRPWGTIVIGDSILCDGKNYLGMDDGKCIACYTHIHDDHIGGLEDALGRFNSKVFATDITKDLSSALLSYDVEWIKYRENYYGLKNNRPEQVGDFEISFHKANHILGSAQLLIRNNRHSVLYSSDFMLEDTDIVKDVDYLVLDSTHGKHSEKQQFEDVEYSREMIIKKTKKIFDGKQKQLIIYAARGTMQLVMFWIRKELGDEIVFLANKTDVNIARVYGQYDYDCGLVEDDKKFREYYESRKPFILFRIRGSSKSEHPITSIRIGATSSSSIKDEQSMSAINLKEHATVSEVCEYVKQIDPKHIIMDNSERTKNPDNASYLKNILTEMGFSVSLSPQKHPQLNQI